MTAESETAAIAAAKPSFARLSSSFHSHNLIGTGHANRNDWRSANNQKKPGSHYWATQYAVEFGPELNGTFYQNELRLVKTAP
jgi:hypothetical protein